MVSGAQQFWMEQAGSPCAARAQGQHREQPLEQLPVQSAGRHFEAPATAASGADYACAFSEWDFRSTVSDEPFDGAGCPASLGGAGGQPLGARNIVSSPWSNPSTVIEADGDSESIEDKSMNNWMKTP